MIQEAIPGGRTQISGGDPFTADSARQLANVLKYGSLPLSFESSEAQTVSATLGLTSLRAGLIAGAIGLVLVLVYSLLYYRVLGVLTALSLTASGAMVFAILVLLGRYINYTLDLAGIAGLIIGIGTTADSFVVFFERIKDEIREGRSFRSAVPRGWVRARKTIVSGNAVTFLAAAVLYVLAIGQVKGFAFTLGLTTILDIVVVFLVTWPLVYLASQVADAGQAGVQRPRRSAAGRPRTPGRQHVRRDGDSAMAAKTQTTETDDARRTDRIAARTGRLATTATRPRCRTTASSPGSTPAPVPSRSVGRRRLWYAHQRCDRRGRDRQHRDPRASPSGSTSRAAPRCRCPPRRPA